MTRNRVQIPHESPAALVFTGSRHRGDVQRPQSTVLGMGLAVLAVLFLAGVVGCSNDSASPDYTVVSKEIVQTLTQERPTGIYRVTVMFQGEERPLDFIVTRTNNTITRSGYHLCYAKAQIGQVLPAFAAFSDSDKLVSCR